MFKHFYYVFSDNKMLNQHLFYFAFNYIHELDICRVDITMSA